MRYNLDITSLLVWWGGKCRAGLHCWDSVKGQGRTFHRSPVSAADFTVSQKLLGRGLHWLRSHVASEAAVMRRPNRGLHANDDRRFVHAIRFHIFKC